MSKPIHTRRYEIVVTSQRYNGFSLMVDVRDADTKEFLFSARKDVAGEIVKVMNSAHSSIG